MESTNLIVSKTHRQLLVPSTPQIQTLFPNAKALAHDGVNYAVVPHGPREHIMLRTIGIEAPSPIIAYYDWEGGKPFQVQKATAMLATANRRAYILNDMGTGKTKASLWSWRYLNRMGIANKLLVVAPLSTLKFTWLREIHATLPGVKAVVLHDTSPQRRRNLLEKSKDAQIFIINHDGLRVLIKELFDRKDIDTLILDELAVYRNRSQRSTRMQTFAERFTWVWGMSGRPMPNAPTDVFHQCKILTPHSVPKFWRHAQSLLMQQVSQFNWVPRQGAVETAFKWMQPSVRYSLDDVVELPEAISRTIDVDMTAEQAKAYQRLSNEFALMIQKQQITAVNAGVAFQKLLQIGAGYVYSVNPNYITLDSEPRQTLLLELLEQAPHKCLVFAPWRHLVDNLSTLLTNNNIEHAVVHGDIKHREEIFSDFQMTEKYRVLLCHPGCVHHGLTLTAATTCIWYSPVASLEIYEQANARIRRVGQQHKQQFLHIQSTQVERRIYSLLRNKQRLQDEFLQLIKQANAMESDNGEQWEDGGPPPRPRTDADVHSVTRQTA